MTITNMLRNFLAVAGGVFVATVVTDWLPNTWLSPDYAGIVLGAIVTGVTATRWPWMLGGMVGAAEAASFIRILMGIVHTYSDHFWRLPNGTPDLHLTFFLHMIAFIVVGVVASGIAHRLVWRKTSRGHRA